MKTRIDYCVICKNTTKCKKCRKSPFKLEGLRIDMEELDGGSDNILIALTGAVAFLLIAGICMF